LIVEIQTCCGAALDEKNTEFDGWNEQADSYYIVAAMQILEIHI
jgi:hypothetical protein